MLHRVVISVLYIWTGAGRRVQSVLSRFSSSAALDGNRWASEKTSLTPEVVRRLLLSLNAPGAQLGQRQRTRTRTRSNSIALDINGRDPPRRGPGSSHFDAERRLDCETQMFLELEDPLHSIGGESIEECVLFTPCVGIGRTSSQQWFSDETSLPAGLDLLANAEDTWLKENDQTGLFSSGRAALERLLTTESDERYEVDAESETLRRTDEDREQVASRKLRGDEFTLRQYNILAARMGNNAMPWMLQGADVSREQRQAIWRKFPDPAWKDELTEDQWDMVQHWGGEVFDWETRKERLLTTIFADDPDIITLQELDKYTTFFKPALQARNYGHIYAQRVNREDGVAIAFKEDRFRLLARSDRYFLPNEYDDIPLHHPGTAFTATDKVKQVLLEKARRKRSEGGYGDLGGRVAVFALLQDRRNPKRKILVGTTHLDKSPNSVQKSLSRINQMSVLNVIQGHLADRWDVKLEEDIVLLAGDLNTDAQEQTMVKQPALAGKDYKLTQMSIQPNSNSCTTLTEDRNLWIDYIFHAGQAEVTGTSVPLRPCQTMPNFEQASDHFAVTATLRWKDDATPSEPSVFLVPDFYNYSRSTEDNYALPHTDKSHLVGPYGDIRKMLDYKYHKIYREERQSLQDSIVKQLLGAMVVDSHSNVSCSSPLNSWIVFTAGGMGAGKSRTMQWLASRGYFPLTSFVYVDPDQIRSMLPETSRYVEKNASSTGAFTQKEAGYISEVLTEAALREGRNILVDGSLRDHEWYLQFFLELRERQPERKIGIIHVRASPKTEYQRAAYRGKITGRVIPDDIMQEAAELIPKSMDALAPHADFFATIENEGAEPRLVNPANMNWEDFIDVWDMECPVPDDD